MQTTCRKFFDTVSSYYGCGSVGSAPIKTRLSQVFNGALGKRCGVVGVHVA
jgi:hypothetical protein